jgi:hypothetical protein
MNTIFTFRFIESYILVLIMCLVNIHAQDYPIVPADMPAYLNETKEISSEGINTRTDWRYVLQDGKVTTNKHIERVLKFDELGRIKEIMNIDPQGENKSVIIFRYDKRNLPVLETEFLPTGELLGKTKYTYDTKGILKDITWLNSYEFVYDRFSFDINDTTGLVTEWHFYSPDSVKQKIEYYYSDPLQGFITRQRIYIGENKLQNTIIWNRDSTKCLLNKEFRDPQGKIEYYLEYHYNTSGKVMQVMRVFPNGSKLKNFEYNYEDAGLKTGEIEYNQKGEIVAYLKFSYD